MVKQGYPSVDKNDHYAILYLLNKGLQWNPKVEGKQNFVTLRAKYAFHVQDYVDIVGFTPPNLPCDQQGINYLAKSLNTNLTVNVKEHLVKHALRYVNLRLRKFFSVSDVLTRFLTFLVVKN